MPPAHAGPLRDRGHFDHPHRAPAGRSLLSLRATSLVSRRRSTGPGLGDTRLSRSFVWRRGPLWDLRGFGGNRLCFLGWLWARPLLRLTLTSLILSGLSLPSSSRRGGLFYLRHTLTIHSITPSNWTGHSLYAIEPQYQF